MPQTPKSYTLEPRMLETFLAVAEASSFTAAAKRLRTNQPAISTRIASLEAGLGVRLFDRGARRSTLTPAGEVLVPHARVILRESQNASLAIERFLGEPGGTLHVGASTVPGCYLLPRILAGLRERLPDVRVRLAVRDTAATLEALRNHEIELAVVGRAIDDVDVEACELGYDEVVLVAAPDFARRHGLYDADPSRLQTLPLILRELGSATRDTTIELLERHGFDPDALCIALEVRGNEGVRAAAVSGIGAAFVSRLAVQALIETGELEEFTGLLPTIRRPLMLAVRRGRTLSPGAEVLASLLRAAGANGLIPSAELGARLETCRPAT